VSFHHDKGFVHILTTFLKRAAMFQRLIANLKSLNAMSLALAS